MNHGGIAIIRVFAVQFTSWACTRDNPWVGEEVTIRIAQEIVNGKERIIVEAKWDSTTFSTMGILSEADIGSCPIGFTGRFKIHPKYFENDRYPRRQSGTDKSSTLYLFTAEWSDEQIGDYLRKLIKPQKSE